MSASSADLSRREELVAPSASELERVVWMLWFQGFENAPEIVRLCLHSWKARNPTWKVVELTDENLSDYIDSDTLSMMRSLDMSRQTLSDLIRIYLLSRHGGVWVDATCFCCKPLDDWLPEYMPSGFFAFRSPGPDRLLANWFLAARKGNLLASVLYEKHRDFFLKNKFPLQNTKRGRNRVKAIRSTLNRNPTIAQLWTYPLLTRTIGVYPYFIFHYQFARTVRENKECREIWDKTPPFSADIPRKMNKTGILSPMTDELLDDLEQAKDPLYKLTYKYRQEYFTNGCILYHIMRSIA